MKHVTMEKGKLVSHLKNALIFQSLDGNDIEKLTALTDTFEYASGEVIVKQDSTSPYIYLIIEGRVNVVYKGIEEEVRIGGIRSGDVFGEGSIFLDEPRTASVVADGPVVIATYSRNQLIDFVNTNPRAGLKIFSFIIYSLLHKLGSVNKELAVEKESTVTEEDIEEIKRLFPKDLEGMIG
jgi:CRP/FNR family transcriptional regulator, cyclic AMP receptor protein